MRALFCTDGSKISYDALENYLNIADKNTTIDVISVIDWSFLPDGVALDDSGFVTSCQNLADFTLEHAQELIEKNHFQTGVMIKRCGAVTESILEQMESEKYNTIVMGSYGKKGIRRWLGSVSREIIESANVPVYLSKNKQCCKRVLFITDGSEVSITAAQHAIQDLNLKDCEIYICSVSESAELIFLNGTFDENWMKSVQYQQTSYANASIEKIKTIFNGYNIKGSDILTGIPAKSILQYSKEKEINLIVVGSKRKSKIQRFLLDSTSKRIIENATCDTFINFML